MAMLFARVLALTSARCLYIATSLVVAMATTNCKGTLYGITGDLLVGYTSDHLLPFALQSDDPDRACHLGVGLGNFINSFERVTDSPDKTAVFVFSTAAVCAEDAANEQELRRIRAVRAGNAEDANDARFAAQHHHLLAAKRQFEAYTRMTMAFAQDKEETNACPTLEDEFDQLVFLLGNLAGVQAVQHDRKGEGLAGVPMDIPRRVSDALNCIDNDKWWGVPKALQAAIWLSIPGSAPEGTGDPWVQLDNALPMGESAGVRLVFAVDAQAALAAGNTDRVRTTIRRFAELDPGRVSQQWRLLDAMAQTQVRSISDLLWTEATGHRTPLSALGNFWDDPTDGNPLDLESLDDLIH